MRLFRKSGLGGLVVVNAADLQVRKSVDGESMTEIAIEKRQNDTLTDNLAVTAGAVANALGFEGDDNTLQATTSSVPVAAESTNSLSLLPDTADSSTTITTPSSSSISIASSALASSTSLVLEFTTTASATTSSTSAPLLAASSSATTSLAQAVNPGAQEPTLSSLQPLSANLAAATSIAQATQDVGSFAPVATELSSNPSIATTVPSVTDLGEAKSTSTPSAVINSELAATSVRFTIGSKATTFETIRTGAGSRVQSATSEIIVSTRTSIIPSNGHTTLVPITSTSVSFFVVPQAETEAPATRQTQPTIIATTSGSNRAGAGQGNTIVAPTASSTPASTPGALNVTESSSDTLNQTTVAITVAILIAMSIAISVIGYFIFRKYFYKYFTTQLSPADSPPLSPGASKFDPQRTPSARIREEKMDDGFVFSQATWDNQISDVERDAGSDRKYAGRESTEMDANNEPAVVGGDLGRNTVERPLSYAPSVVRSESGKSQGSQKSYNSQRDTLRVFPNTRPKLGGKEIDANL